MASSAARKECAHGDDCKQTGVAHCEGCARPFCIKHFNDHRRVLDEEMNVLISHYNEFKATLDEETASPFISTRLREINQWEVESIEKIQQKADELRRELLELKVIHIESVSLKFKLLSDKIQESKMQDDFIEVDLHRWSKRLDDLKSNLISPTTIAFTRRPNSPLITNVAVSFLWTGNEIFARTLNNDLQIEQDGEVVKGISYFMWTNEIRGKNSYAFGCHKVRLQLEHSSKQWTFLGINAREVPLQKSSHEAKSAYGWCSDNHICSNGSCQENRTSSSIDMNVNDTITLIFDCDNRQISMINERTVHRHDLTVDLEHCPFPWQLHVALRNRNTCVRLLSA